MDPYGNPQVIPPPPLSTAFEDFLAQIQQRNSTFMWTGANFLVSISSQILQIAFMTTLTCLIVSLFNMSKGMNKDLPKTKRDKMKIAKKAAYLEMTSKVRFSPKESGSAESDKPIDRTADNTEKEMDEHNKNDERKLKQKKKTKLPQSKSAKK